MVRGAAFFLVLAVAAFQSGETYPRNLKSNEHPLQDDLNDFRSLLPAQKIKSLVFQYLNSDKEFQEFVQYVMNDSTKELISEFEKSETVKEIFKYLHDAGTDIYNLLNKVHEFFGMAPYNPSVRIYGEKITGGLRGFFEDLHKLIPHDQLKALYEEKIKSSPEFIKFVEFVKSRAQKLADEIAHIKHVRELYNYLKNKNVDVTKFVEFINGFFGIHVNARQAPSSPLQDDLNAFRSLLPAQKIKSLVFQYLNSDKEFQEFVQYVMSDKTKDVISAIENIKPLKEIFKYLHDAGTDVYDVLNKIHALFGMEPYNPSVRVYGEKITGGLRGFFEDLHNLVPHDKLKAVYDEKIKSSPDFVKFVDFVKSRAQKAMDELSHIKEVRQVFDYLKNKHVDVGKFIDFISGFFGVHVDTRELPSSPLQDDLNAFRALLPAQKIKSLVFEYLNSDIEFQEFAQYIMSDKTKEMITKIEKIRPLKEIIKYLDDAGTNIYELLNKIHAVFGMEPYNPSVRIYGEKITGGLRGFFEDLHNLVPHDELKALYEEKVQNSPEFTKFVEFVQSRAQKIIDELSHNHQVRDLYRYLKRRNVDVDKFVDFISGFFGVHVDVRELPSSPLQDDLNAFRALLPAQKIKSLVFEYLNSDIEFQEFAQYIMSDKTKEMITKIEKIRPLKEIIKYLDDAGTNIYELLNKIHAVFGMEPYNPSVRIYGEKITGGLRGFFEDLHNLVPHDELKALYEEKVQNSPEFTKFVEFVKSRAQKIIDELSHNHQVRDLYRYLKRRNVDVGKFVDFISGFFGVHVDARQAPSSPLQDDLNAFRSLLPAQKIKSLVFEYLNSDREFQTFVRYIMTDKTKDVISAIENIKPLKEIFKYLHDAGTDVYDVLNKIHALFGMEPYNPSVRVYGEKITGGLRGFFEDLHNLVPHDKLKAVYDEKIKSSPDFVKFVDFVKSRAQKAMDELSHIKEVRQVFDYLKNKHVDVGKFIDFISGFFGVHVDTRELPSSPLQDDLNAFRALLPAQKIKSLVFEYLNSDIEFQEFAQYIMSNKTKEMITKIEKIRPLKEIIKYLDDAGTNIYELLNKIHAVFGMEPYNPSVRIYGEKITGGLRGFFEDLHNLVPHDELKALYEEKVQNSPEFTKFVEFVKSRAQKIVDKLTHINQVRDLYRYLKRRNVDVGKFVDFISGFFGIHVNTEQAPSSPLQDDLNKLHLFFSDFLPSLLQG